MNILWIYDKLDNGKSGRYVREYNKKAQIKYICIKDFHNTKLVNKINFYHFNIVFFDYNEDEYNFNGDLKKVFKRIKNMKHCFNNVYNYINKKYPKKIIINNPNKCYSMGDKNITYNLLSQIKNPVVQIPKYIIYDENNNNLLDEIDYFPVIVKSNKAANDKKDTICKNKNEILKVINDKFENKKNILIVEYIDSYDKEFSSYHKIRWLVYDNNMVQHQTSSGSKFNIHNKSTTRESYLNMKTKYEQFYKTHETDIQDFLDAHFEIYGHGTYSLDLIYKDDKIFLCENGLKIYDKGAEHYLDKNEIIKVKKHFSKFIENLIKLN